MTQAQILRMHKLAPKVGISISSLASHRGFIRGYEAAMKETEGLVEALEFYAGQQHCIHEIENGEIAREALLKYQG